MARNDKNVVAAALAALEALTAPRTLFRSPVACVPTVTTRHEQRGRASCWLPWPRHSTHAARRATCRCPQKPRKTGGIPCPSPTKTHRASSHLAVRPTTALQRAATPSRDPASHISQDRPDPATGLRGGQSQADCQREAGDLPTAQICLVSC